MSTIFLNGLMPERHEVFIRRLAEQYTLTGTRMAIFNSDPDIETIDFEAESPGLAAYREQELAADVADQTAVLVANLQNDLQHSPQGPGPQWHLSEREIAANIRPRVEAVLLRQARFRHFLADHAVDMVISGADYSSHARVIARLARQAGLPTLDLEHGFFFNYFAPGYTLKRGHLPNCFASEYVNLDNRLEVAVLQEQLSHFPDQGTRFLALGTPVDTVANHEIPREQALATLGLDPQKTQVMLAGSWHEARSLQKLVTAQVKTISGYEELFSALAASPQRDNLELVIKLHPADAHPEVITGVRAGLTAMALRCGLPSPRILTDKLPEALAACDVVLAMDYSSVLYDAFLLGKPSVVYFPGVTAYGDRPNWGRESTLPQRAGVSVATSDGTEAWRLVASWSDPARRARFERDRAAFSTEYDLHIRPVEEKCERLLEWIAGQIANRRPAALNLS